MGNARNLIFLFVQSYARRNKKQHIRDGVKQCDPFSGNTSVPRPLAYRIPLRGRDYIIIYLRLGYLHFDSGRENVRHDLAGRYKLLLSHNSLP